jgi:hypothetical protein
MKNWQPIETAPKDGTKILILDRDGDIEISEWYQSFHDEYVQLDNGFYRKETKIWSQGWNGNGHRATHWMPLPEKPQ